MSAAMSSADFGSEPVIRLLLKVFDDIATPGA
jgi:hypothetical protein